MIVFSPKSKFSLKRTVLRSFGVAKRVFGFSSNSSKSGVESLLLSVPTKAVPAPSQRRWYLQEAMPHVHVYAFRVARMVWTGSAAFVLAAITFTTVQAAQSLPGDRLYGYKKTVEQARIKIAGSTQKQAELQLDLSAKRIEEARTVIALTRDPKQTSAALDEIRSQTETAAKTVTKAIVDNDTQKPEDLAVRLSNLAEQQSALAETLPMDLGDVGGASTDEVVQKVTESVAAAAQSASDVNDLIVASKDSVVETPKPEVTVVTAVVVILKEDVVTLDKVEYKISSDFKVESSEGLALASPKLGLGQTVEASISEGQLLSAKIIKLPSKLKPVVQPVPEEVAPQPNTTKGTFILEQPAPEFETAPPLK